MQAYESLNTFPLTGRDNESGNDLVSLEARIKELEERLENQDQILKSLAEWRIDHIFRQHKEDDIDGKAVKRLIDLVASKKQIRYSDARRALELNKSYFSQVVSQAVDSGEIGIRSDPQDRRRKYLWSKRV